jgi:uncharacterized membrane protein
MRTSRAALLGVAALFAFSGLVLITIGQGIGNASLSAVGILLFIGGVVMYFRTAYPLPHDEPGGNQSRLSAAWRWAGRRSRNWWIAATMFAGVIVVGFIAIIVGYLQKQPTTALLGAIDVLAFSALAYEVLWTPRR